ncbi:BTB/POZ domain-containing protein 2-like isoform X2 [Paramacrobiotus metropolitanus]|uniref:BTB/POZ domain-containing protein 2-like isoform X2 n=1 Tax=Paramacrobiotus metropolitanus TaxID=2943436 RepID=UPI00244586D4|nr:BTB/POZ domain-containing protein 2-like isoform X2 [Paramacrobiotus metropolitanus]
MTEHFASSVARPVAGFHDVWKQLLVSGEKSDVRFAVGRESGEAKIFAAHKFLLSVRSDVFDRMFNGDLRENTAQPIDIPEIRPAAFAAMLSFVYTGTVDAVEGLPEPCSLSGVDSVFEVLYCADKYNLKELTKLALHVVFRRLDHDTCLDYLENAQRCGMESCARVVQKCLNWVDCFTDVILAAERFCAVSRDTLLRILQRGSLRVEENAVYLAAEKWAKAACLRDDVDASPDSCRAQLDEALFLIRFPLMTDAQLTDGPVKKIAVPGVAVRYSYRIKATI